MLSRDEVLEMADSVTQPETVADGGQVVYRMSPSEAERFAALVYRRAIEDAAGVSLVIARGWAINPKKDGCGGVIAAEQCAFNIRELARGKEH